MPDIMLRMQYLDLYLPTIIAAYHLPMLLPLTLVSILCNSIVGMFVWLPGGACADVCRRAASPENHAQALPLVEYVLAAHHFVTMTKNASVWRKPHMGRPNTQVVYAVARRGTPTLQQRHIGSRVS